MVIIHYVLLTENVNRNKLNVNGSKCKCRYLQYRLNVNAKIRRAPKACIKYLLYSHDIRHVIYNYITFYIQLHF